MAKQNQKQEVAKKVELTAENVMDQIRSKNIGDQSINEQANKLLKDEQNERKVRETKRAIAKAQYTNLKALLMLRKQRLEEKAIKEYLNETKSYLDEFAGYTNDKNEFVNPTITVAEYEDKITEAKKKKRDAFREAQKKYDTEYRELRNQYPEYWAYEWDE